MAAPRGSRTSLTNAKGRRPSGEDHAPAAPAAAADARRPPQAWVEAVLKAINSRRAAHGALPLVWSDMCFGAARRQAEKCMEAGMAFNGHVETLDGMQGQCLRGPIKPALSLKARCAEDVVEFWYKEVSKYNFDEPGTSPKAVNFSQLVWSGTSSVGMALSPDGRYCVANFYPPGNEPEWNFPRCVRRARGGPPPWAPEPAPLPEIPPLCASNWAAHEALEESMRKAAERRPELDDGDFAFE